MLLVFSDFCTEIQVEVWSGSCRDDEISIFPFPVVLVVYVYLGMDFVLVVS